MDFPLPCNCHCDMHEPTGRVRTLARSRAYKDSSMSQPLRTLQSCARHRWTSMDGYGQAQDGSTLLSSAVAVEEAGLHRVAQRGGAGPGCLKGTARDQ